MYCKIPNKLNNSRMGDWGWKYNFENNEFYMCIFCEGVMYFSRCSEYGDPMFFQHTLIHVAVKLISHHSKQIS